MTANIIWNDANADCGTVGASACGASPTPRKPRCASPPITPPTSGPNASEYPASTHTTETIAIAATECIIVPSTFFERTSPP